MKGAISSKGQITVPIEIRQTLGLTPGTLVRFEIVKGGALIRKGTAGPHPVDEVFGKLRLRAPVDALLDQMRGPRPKRR